MDDPSPPQISVEAFLSSTSTPAFQTAPMTGQLMGYHLSSEESAKRLGCGVKDKATWRGEEHNHTVAVTLCFVSD